MAIKNTGVAARAGQEPAKSAEQVQREYRLQQKFNQISKADNASTTGLLVNPPAAVIPNTTQYYSNNSGSGKEAGAQGMFGAQLGGGGQQYPTVYGQPTPTNSQFAPPVVKGFNAQVGGGAGLNQNILYQTGDQGVTTVINGQKMNVPPNTTVYKSQQPNLYNSLNNAWNTFTGGEPAAGGSGLAGTRGAIPTNSKVPGLASPAKDKFYGVQAGGGLVNHQVAGNPNTYHLMPPEMQSTLPYMGTAGYMGLAHGEQGALPYFGTAGYSALYNQQQAMAANPFYGAQAGGGAQNITQAPRGGQGSSTTTQNAPITQSNVNPNKGTAGYYADYNNSKNSQMNVQHPTTPQYGGTAGMYTYGQFTNREDAFTALIGKVAQYEQATGTASGMTIPATIADNLGLTASLQDPSSGWKFQNGVWVNTNKPNAPGAGNDYSKLGSTDFTSTQFYQDYAAKNVPFEQQMRYDPASGKYISVGAYMLKKKDKNAYLTRGDRQTKLAQRQKQARKVGYGEQQTSSPADSSSYYQPVDQQPTPFTGSWGVVNFNTGTG